MMIAESVFVLCGDIWSVMSQSRHRSPTHSYYFSLALFDRLKSIESLLLRALNFSSCFMNSTLFWGQNDQRSMISIENIFNSAKLHAFFLTALKFDFIAKVIAVQLMCVLGITNFFFLNNQKWWIQPIFCFVFFEQNAFFQPKSAIKKVIRKKTHAKHFGEIGSFLE